MDSIARPPPVLGLMLGDCAGIGPEQCARILSDGRLNDAARLVVVGDTRVLQQGARDAGVELCTRSYAAPEAIEAPARPGSTLPRPVCGCWRSGAICRRPSVSGRCCGRAPRRSGSIC